MDAYLIRLSRYRRICLVDASDQIEKECLEVSVRCSPQSLKSLINIRESEASFSGSF